MKAVKSIIENRTQLIKEVDEATYATDDNIVTTAITAHRFDIAKYLLENGFRKPPSAVTSQLK